MKAIIVEDEEPARDLLRRYLQSYSDIEIVGEYIDGFEGAKAINQLKPDIVFLDIQLPRLTGLEMLELIDYSPLIIFTTAYDEFAISAFEKHAVDYLLKPFSLDRFSQAVQRAISRVSSKSAESVTPSELGDTITSGATLTRIVVRTPKAINVIPVEDILYLEAQDDYVMIHTTKGRFLKKQTLKHYDDRLDSNWFVRIHRSYTVNINSIDRLEPYEKESYLAILKNMAKLKVSSTGYKLLRSRLEF